MWLLATGYTFLAQAGSAGNDTFPTVYALAAVDFACRTWGKSKVQSPKCKVQTDLGYSVLAAALFSGAKSSNISLLLACGVLAVARRPRLRLRAVFATYIIVF